MPLAPRVGTSYELDFKIPPDPAATRFFDAGGLRFGVERRALNAAVLQQAYGHDPEWLARTRPEFQQGLELQAPSIHVFDADSAEEYLRIDAFDEEPHYHYIYPGSHHTIVWWDQCALGPFPEQVPVLLHHRLRSMLAVVVEADRLARIDWDAVAAVVPEVVAEFDRFEAQVTASS
ncbi:MAG: hypothetical protein EPO13_11645 [Actinomycetota bacterium]|nr:MAG: hypothetical protein EPO13_11645 [Actinomycetota bacterium]